MLSSNKSVLMLLFVTLLVVPEGGGEEQVVVKISIKKQELRYKYLFIIIFRTYSVLNVILLLKFVKFS